MGQIEYVSYSGDIVGLVYFFCYPIQIGCFTVEFSLSGVGIEYDKPIHPVIKRKILWPEILFIDFGTVAQHIVVANSSNNGKFKLLGIFIIIVVFVIGSEICDVAPVQYEGYLVVAVRFVGVGDKILQLVDTDLAVGYEQESEILFRRKLPDLLDGFDIQVPVQRPDLEQRILKGLAAGSREQQGRKGQIDGHFSSHSETGLFSIH